MSLLEIKDMAESTKEEDQFIEEERIRQNQLGLIGGDDREERPNWEQKAKSEFEHLLQARKTNKQRVPLWQDPLLKRYIEEAAGIPPAYGHRRQALIEGEKQKTADLQEQITSQWNQMLERRRLGKKKTFLQNAKEFLSGPNREMAKIRQAKRESLEEWKEVFKKAGSTLRGSAGFLKGMRTLLFHGIEKGLAEGTKSFSKEVRESFNNPHSKTTSSAGLRGGSPGPI